MDLFSRIRKLHLKMSKCQKTRGIITPTACNFLFNGLWRYSLIVSINDVVSTILAIVRISDTFAESTVRRDLREVEKGREVNYDAVERREARFLRRCILTVR